ncbi:Predicted kinase, aminoglycoside phosphotransferase (APT) family [Lentibacillus persicus]|uniref:Predicted kinase, aminoglycoside phosphotransferase (APT) family n=1 Tax=Lentibacillus persicus TaxID=640948 RepID=A0A1I1SAZ8_9BACI|nr:phosphotransferase family protein [Lentibacillus persicus]SFD43492.1 Predicted kinase, aminoglycoside phosphotransferase (APT) family [Lentibacillus persicus]
MSVKQDITEVREGEDFDRQAVKQYIAEQYGELPTAPLEVKQFSTGLSNLTYFIRFGDWEGVLRRPPDGPLPPKAHDMKRESTFLKKLHPYFSYVPEPYVMCEDTSIIGVPFYVMERKKGIVLDEEFPPDVEITEARLRKLSYAVVDRLTELHTINYEEAGLKQFGHPNGFIERQVHGWINRYEKTKTDSIPYVDKVCHWLIDNIPKTAKSSIIHNDYKLNNMLLSRDLTSINAILDWEMATIGDPLFDLGGALVYWVQQDDPESIKKSLPAITAKKDGFISRNEFIERYARKTNNDIQNMDFYIALNYFKLGVALQQIYYRWKIGKSRDERFAEFHRRAKRLIKQAYKVVDRKLYP